MYCPKCKKKLIIIEFCNIELDYCMHCKGIWFDSDELKILSCVIPGIDFADPSFADFTCVKDKTDEAIRQCPRCETNMDKGMFKGQPPVIDCCPNNHGYWFDAKELQEYVKNNKTKSGDTPITFLQEVLN